MVKVEKETCNLRCRILNFEFRKSENIQLAASHSKKKINIVYNALLQTNTCELS